MLVSALTGEGFDRLAAAIEARLAATRVMLDLVLDPADGAGVSWLHRHTEVMAKTMTDDHMALRVRVDPAKADVVRAKFAASAAAGEGGRDETRKHNAGDGVARRRGHRKRGG